MKSPFDWPLLPCGDVDLPHDWTEQRITLKASFGWHAKDLHIIVSNFHNKSNKNKIYI